jgi:hypothetical protein
LVVENRSITPIRIKNMQPLILTALISLVVASLSGFISSYITISIETRKLRIDLKKAYAVELFKKRLEAYPPVWEALGQLSEQAVVPLNSVTAEQVGHQLNHWLYSVGGLCADRETRRALLDVRNACLDLKDGDVSVRDIRDLRDVAMIHLRRDLALKGLESFDAEASGKEDEITIRE